MIYNPDYCLTIAQSGIGFSTHRSIDHPITKNDQQAGRYLYIRDNDTNEFWSATWYPTATDIDEFQATHRLGATEIASEKNKITTQVTFRVNETEPCEYWQIQLVNNSPRKRRLSVFALVEWDKGTQESQFHDNAIISCTPYNQDKLLARIFTLDHAADSFDCDWDQFIGRYGNLSQPKALVDGKCSRSFGNDNRLAVLQRNITIGAGSDSEFVVVLGASIVDNFSLAKRLAKRLAKVSGSSAAQLPERIVIKSPDHDINLLTNYWSKLQSLAPIPDTATTLTRLSQHSDLAMHQPDRLRNELETVLKQQYRDGSLLRSIIEPLPEHSIATLSQFITTLGRYLNESGDIAFLSEHIQFFDSGSASVLEHLTRSCNTLLDQMKTDDLTLADKSTTISAIRKVIPIFMQSGEHQFVRKIERTIEDQTAKINRQWSGSSTPEINSTIQVLSAQVLSEKNQKAATKHLTSEMKRIGNMTSDEIPLAIIISTVEQLAQNSETEQSIELLEKFLPTFRSKNSELYQAEPYLFPQSISTDPQRRGQASRDLDNFVAARFSSVFIETILGILPTIGGLKIDPHIPRSWRQYEVSREFRGATYHIRVSNPLRVTSGVGRLSINGLHTTGQVIRPFKTGNHFVEVTLG